MFPRTDTAVETAEYKTISDDLCYTPDYDFTNKETILKNGAPVLRKDAGNLRNWFVKFLTTPADKVEIYKGTGFGTSLPFVMGLKNIDAFSLIQIESEIRQGALLHPFVQNIRNVEFSGEGDALKIKISAELKDGSVWEDEEEVFKICL